MISLANNRW